MEKNVLIKWINSSQMENHKWPMKSILEKKWYTLLTVREMQVITILKFQVIPVKMSVFTKTNNKTCVKNMEKNPLHCQKCELVQSLWGPLMRFSTNKQINQPAKKTKMEITRPIYFYTVSKHTTAVLTDPRDCCTIYYNQEMKPVYIVNNRWMDKEIMVGVH